MKRTVFYLVLACVLLAGCKPGNNLNIEGTIRGAKNGTLYLFAENRGELKKTDSLEMKKGGRFSFSGNIDRTGLYYISFGSVSNRFNFFAEPESDITINGQVDSLNFAKVEGGPVQSLYNEFNDYMRGYADNSREVYIKLLSASAKKSDSLNYYMEKWDKLKLNRERFIAQFAFSHSDSEISPFIAFHYIGPSFPVILDTIAGTITPEVAGSHYGSELMSLREQIKLSAVGMKAPAFEAESGGQKVNNETYLGSPLYILVWQTEGQDNVTVMTRLKELYPEFEKNGVRVLSSCVTGDDALYEQAGSHIGFLWTDIPDSRGAYNEFVNRFALTDLPSSILISAEGEIIARGIAPDDVLKALNQDKLY